MLVMSGSSTWARTRDLRINSPSLYQLSYRGIFRCSSSCCEKLGPSAYALNRKERIIEHFVLLKKTLMHLIAMILLRALRTSQCVGIIE